MRANTLGAMFDEAVARAPDQPAYHYFDGRCSYRQLAEDVDRFGIFLRRRGVRAGDRVMLCLQNVPAFVIAVVATAKLGAITVPVNPMYGSRELGELLADATPTVLICHDKLLQDVLPDLVENTPSLVPGLLLTVSPLDRQTENHWWPSREAIRASRRFGATTFEEALLAGEIRGDAGSGTEDSLPDQASTAMLVYTSGTTGKPKGAIITHGNVCSSAICYVEEAGLDGDARVLALAPLFHVTGLSGHVFASLAAAGCLILAYRFQPDLMLETITRHQPTFTIGAITALMGLIDHPDFARDTMASIRTLMSGGAPVSPAQHRRFGQATGIPIRNAYGLTETTSLVTTAPADVGTPVDPLSGALSVGKPVGGAVISIVGDDGVEVPAGSAGELVVKGPGICAGYWNKPAETKAAIDEQGFHTGDIAVQDAAGWIYLVDRKKDMIVASGFKVWPREVEDVLHAHPAVREAAVVGVADAYRGETVRAVVSLRTGVSATPAELIDFCKARLAAYKYPREVLFVDELPRTATGKIIKTALRHRDAG